LIIHLGDATGDRSEPSTSRAESSNLISISNTGRCIFCKEEFADNEKVPNTTKRGFDTLIASCKASNDEIGTTITGASKKGYKKFPYKYHSSCRELYTNTKIYSYCK
jgi:hypothetical protein